MYGDYDTEADALEIVLKKVDRFSFDEPVEEGCCHVALTEDVPVYVELISPAKHLHLLTVVAERYNLDAEELLATAQAALAAPDHLVEVSIGKSLVA